MNTIYRHPLQKKKKINSVHISTLGCSKNVYDSELINTKSGLNTLNVEAKHFSPGIYFYTITAGDISVIKKMIVE